MTQLEAQPLGRPPSLELFCTPDRPGLEGIAKILDDIVYSCFQTVSF
jgi:hypothetical protein